MTEISRLKANSSGFQQVENGSLVDGGRFRVVPNLPNMKDLRLLNGRLLNEREVLSNDGHTIMRPDEIYPESVRYRSALVMHGRDIAQQVLDEVDLGSDPLIIGIPRAGVATAAGVYETTGIHPEFSNSGEYKVATLPRLHGVDFDKATGAILCDEGIVTADTFLFLWIEVSQKIAAGWEGNVVMITSMTTDIGRDRILSQIEYPGFYFYTGEVLLGDEYEIRNEGTPDRPDWMKFVYLSDGGIMRCGDGVVNCLEIREESSADELFEAILVEQRQQGVITVP